MSRTPPNTVGISTIAFCASLTVHAALVAGMAGYYVASVGQIHLPGFDRDATAQADQTPVYIPRVPVPDPHEFQLGRQDGAGHATDDTPGETALVARKGDADQGDLSRDPEGPGNRENLPSPSVVPQGNPSAGAGGANGNNGASGATAAISPPAVQAKPPLPPQETKPEEDESRRKPFGAAGADESSAAEAHPTDLPSVEKAPVQKSDAPPEAGDSKENHEAETSGASPAAAAMNPPVAAAPGNPGAPGQSGPVGPAGGTVPPADPAPQSDTESDPFSVVGGAAFKPGSTDAQLGRQHRLTRPRIGLAGIADASALGRLTLVLQLTIDPAGNIKNAKVFRSSGSANIDQACKVAAYEWWFEPKKDKLGKPTTRDETFLFVITFS